MDETPGGTHDQGWRQGLAREPRRQPRGRRTAAVTQTAATFLRALRSPRLREPTLCEAEVPGQEPGLPRVPPEQDKKALTDA